MTPDNITKPGDVPLFKVIVLAILAMAVIAVPPPALSQEQTPPEWEYAKQIDDISGKPIYLAAVESTATVEFSPPYEGVQRATLRLQEHPRWGSAAVLSIERGQFVCAIKCKVSVRFDDKAPMTFPAIVPVDRSTTSLILDDYRHFLPAMLKAHVVRIEATVFQEGTIVFPFDVSGFSRQRVRDLN